MVVDEGEQNNTVVRNGAAYIFEKQAGVWSQTAYLKSSQILELGEFGTQVDVSGDGLTAVVGTNRADNIEAFSKNTTTGKWQRLNTIKTAGIRGTGLALSQNGLTLTVGSSGPRYSNGSIILDSVTATRAAHVYTRANTTSPFSNPAELKPSDLDSIFRYGYNVGISADGLTVAVSARRQA